ncbi:MULTISPECIES: hypothetical protein [Bacillus cereus group]|nr:MULTISPECIES: hypothetical protein [Bacillus cereus group]PEA66951.1 hypothetical protein COO18_09380 [Bacillus toyonensis]QWH47766.1 hypothetical protein EXW64_26500 [Bacillus toyonensis]
MLFVNILSGVIQTAIILMILKKLIIEKKFSFNYTFLIIYYLIFTIPLILDMILGIPKYSERSQHIYEFVNTEEVILIFNIINIIIFCVFFIFKKEFSLEINLAKMQKKSLLNLILLTLTLAPVILVLININNIPSFKYGYLVAASKYNSDILSLYQMFLNITMLSVPAGLIYLILNRQKHIYISFIVYFSVVLSMYINGKRMVVFLFFILLLVKVYINNTRRFVTMICISVVSVVIFNNFYSTYFDENYGLNKFSNDGYLQFRIDYSRDHNVKMAIFKELNENENPILEYRGQSFLYNVSFFINRENWEDKPYPYGVYVTAASVGLAQSQNLGWQMTTSMLDESIANMGLLLGVTFFILFFMIILKIGYKFREDILILTITNFIIFLFLTMQFSFSMPFVLFWICLIVFKYIQNRLRFSKSLS